MDSCFSAMVHLEVPVDAAFALLSDPRRRPTWQSSLRRVIMVDLGEPQVGTRWYDVTVVGARPLLEITEWQTDRRWVEVGRWHGVEAILIMDFSPTTSGCTITATADLSTPGWRRPLGWGARLFGPYGVRHDLRRAGHLLR